ncbi:unnamed protein product [Arctia plantaginis]|uniref:Uncharacterized protein n=1 Tax=Arctia plantaginis TaxID=874455 RepID=A0A8S1A6Z9_ARCPL|nr:unnamed protein product [Arctia plantaginis]CAB3240344.1 unnamed protein product [Arctia plantaginis]
MSYDPWTVYKDRNDPSSIDYNKLSNMFQNGRSGYSVSVSTSSTTTSYFPVFLVVGLVVGCGVLFCLIVLCCICFRRKTPGRILVAPPAVTTQTTAPYLQEQTNPCYNMPPAGGAALYPMVPTSSPSTYASEQTTAQYKAEIGASGYPPAYETDRMLHVDSKPPLH